MAARRTNLALAGVLALALATGAGAFAAGSNGGRLVVAAHGAAGLAIVLLVPWKSAIVRRGLRRRPRPGRASALALAGVTVIALAFGVAHSTGLARTFGPVTAMQLHVGAALAAAAFALRHILTRPQRPRRADLNRRALLRLGALTSAATLSWLTLEGALRLASLPGARRRWTGSYETGTGDPTAMPVTQWLDDPVPRLTALAGASAAPVPAAPASLAASGWRLELRSAAGTRGWTLEELDRFGDRVVATLDCTGGWWARQEWEGVWLGRLLPRGAAGAIEVVSATGYRRRFPVGEAGRLLLATRVGGAPLSAGHGYPARLVAPGRRGFWWVKWVERVEVGARPWWLQPPFPPT
jgi:DMSO/TMAO reductase YedYZ molybdopterin-dependent catalytic subunit